MSKVKKGSIVFFSVVLASVFTFVFCLTSIKAKPIYGSEPSTVVIDAGHGGIDGGVIGRFSKTKESELNLSVAKKLKAYLEDAEYKVVMTRNSDAGLYGIATKNLKKKDMQKRKEIINESNASMVISIHMNSFPTSSRRGAQVFYKKGDDKAKLLAESVQSELNEMKECVKKSSALTGDYYILNCSDTPSVIVECGFLSNKYDDELLNKTAYQEEIAYTIFKGIVKYNMEASFGDKK